MRKITILLVCVVGAVDVAVPATLQPLNVRNGLWQMTETVAWTGVPPELQAALANGQTHSYQSCVKPEDLSTNPWAEGSGEKCVWTVITSTGTDMEVQGTGCNMGAQMGMTAEVHGKIHVVDKQDGTGSFDVTLSGNGQTLRGHASYTGKWIAPSCPTQ